MNWLPFKKVGLSKPPKHPALPDGWEVSDLFPTGRTIIAHGERVAYESGLHWNIRGMSAEAERQVRYAIADLLAFERQDDTARAEAIASELDRAVLWGARD